MQWQRTHPVCGLECWEHCGRNTGESWRFRANQRKNRSRKSRITEHRLISLRPDRGLQAVGTRCFSNPRGLLDSMEDVLRVFGAGVASVHVNVPGQIQHRQREAVAGCS